MLPLRRAMAEAPGATTVAEAYAKTSYATVGDLSAEAYLKQLGVDLPTMWKAANPAPAWIRKGWATNKTAFDQEFQASVLVQAAINRTWTEACESEYQKYQSVSEQLKGSRPWQEAMAEKNYYARLDKLRTLLIATGDELIGKGRLHMESRALLASPLADIVYELARTNADAGKAAETDRILTAVIPVNLARALQAQGGPLLSKAAYCALGLSHGASKTLPALPKILNTFRDHVAWPPYPNERDAQIAAELDKHIGTRNVVGNKAPDKTKNYQSAVIEKVEVIGETTQFSFRVTTNEVAAEPSKCKKIGRKWENNRWVDDLACVYPNIESTEHVEVRAILPSDLQLKVGDVATLTVQFEKEPAWDKRVKGKTIVRTRKASTNLFHLEKLMRDQKVVAAY